MGDITDKIFVQAEVNPVFSAQGSINHIEQAGGYKTKADATHINAGYKTGNVGHDTTTHTNQRAASVHFIAGKFPDNVLNGIKIFMVFTGLNHNGAPVFEFGFMGIKYIFIGNEYRTLGICYLMQR